MPGTIITTSPDIALLDISIHADTCGGLFYVDLIPSIWIASGATLVQGAKVQITNPLNVVVKNYGSSFEISPALSGGMDASVTFAIPTISGGFQLGKYRIDVQLTDQNGTVFTNSKMVSICASDKNKPTLKYGSLSAQLNGNCQTGKVAVIIDNVPNYNGTIVQSQLNDFVVDYPTGSGLPELETAQTNFNVQLYEGVYKVAGTICAKYNFTDNVFVSINYKVKREKDIKCIIDLCCVNAQLKALVEKGYSDCTDEEKNNTASILLEALGLVTIITSDASCGNDPSDSVTRLEELLGCSCTCNCNEGTPIINNSPSSDVSIEGCNVSYTQNGLSKVYTIENYTYTVSITDNGGVLTIAAPTLEDCNKNQVITFNLSVLYTQIKEQATNDTEICFWASVVRRCLFDIDPTCLGLTPQQFALLSFSEIMQAIINANCSAGICAAEITNESVVNTGDALKFLWDDSVGTDHVEIFVDSVLRGTVLGGVGDFVYLLPFDHKSYDWALVPVCSNGSYGTVIYGSVSSFARTFVAPPQIYTPYLMGICPYDITTNVLPLPLGISVEFHRANNYDASTLVPDPTNALQSTYWVFGKDTNGFYSEGVQMQVVCDPTGSCSAPQNLQVVPQFGGTQIKFQSAAYPPPMNSYTVKRRLKSDSDIPANYTTIGSPSWNASASRWVIADMTSVPNQLYTYRAISNCGTTEPYIDTDYAEIPCVGVALTPKVTTVDYAFFPPSGAVDKVETTIYSDNGVTVIHTDTHLATFASMVSGSLVYLNPNTNYYVKNRIYIGTYYRDCPLQLVKTLSNESTLTIDYVAGTWLATLSNVLADSITFGLELKALGSNSDVCSGTLQSSTLPSTSIAAGSLSASTQDDALTYLSTYYHIQDGLPISGYGTINSGDTFNVEGATVTLQINHLSCGFYPA